MLYYKRNDKKIKENDLKEITNLRNELLNKKDNKTLIKVMKKINYFSFKYNLKNSIYKINDYENINNENLLLLNIVLIINMLDLLYYMIKKNYVRS